MADEKERIAQIFTQLPKSEQSRLMSDYSLLSSWVKGQLSDISGSDTMRKIWEIIKFIIETMFFNR